MDMSTFPPPWSLFCDVLGFYFRFFCFQTTCFNVQTVKAHRYNLMGTPLVSLCGSLTALAAGLHGYRDWVMHPKMKMTLSVPFITQPVINMLCKACTQGPCTQNPHGHNHINISTHIVHTHRVSCWCGADRSVLWLTWSLLCSMTGSVWLSLWLTTVQSLGRCIWFDL